MNERIRNHINQLFEDAPKTRKAFELKEELLANSEERYQDLVTNGIEPEDAIRNVINSIGSVEELFQGLEEPELKDREEYKEYIKKAARYKTIAAGIYIFSVALFFFFVYLDNEMGWGMRTDFIMPGLIIALVIDIIPTCMLVYISSLAPGYRSLGYSVVEDFKEWQCKAQKSRSVKNALSGVLWTAALFFYFAVSIITLAWYVTWIIFLVAACLQTVIVLIFRLRE